MTLSLTYDEQAKLDAAFEVVIAFGHAAGSFSSSSGIVPPGPTSAQYDTAFAVMFRLMHVLYPDVHIHTSIVSSAAIERFNREEANQEIWNGADDDDDDDDDDDF